MNLIEQLGGYENVSKHFNRVEYHAETKIFIGEWFGFYSMRDLKAALLYYRRQHNIFEVGDKVVLKNNEQEGVLTVQMFKDDFIRAYLDDFKYSFGHQINFRHATDEEIAAGRRL